MVEIQPPSYMTGGCYSAADMRGVYNDFICAEGVSSLGALKVTPATGDSMQVKVAAGSAWIEGTVSEGQGYYRVYNDSPVTLTIADADTTDARIDLVIARVYDSEYEGTEDKWAIEVVQGTPGPTPEWPELPNNSLVLASIDVPAGLESVTTEEVTDARVNMTLCGASSTPLAKLAYTADGTFSPTDYPTTAVAYVECIGAGGGGGGAGQTGSNSCAAGSGGGGGGFGAGWVPIADMGGAPVAVTVGAGGAGGANGGSQPSAGGDSSFGAFIVAGGGKAGTSVTGQTGAFYNITGGESGNGSGTHITAAASGERGTNGISNAANNIIVQLGFGGGAARGGGGAKAGASDSGQGGLDGQAPGGGGSAGWNRQNQDYRAGGTGARGSVRVTVFA